MCKSPKTIICDIDGTLVYHHGSLDEQMTKESTLLPGTLENFREWVANDYKIILVTGRKSCYREITEKQLLRLGICYDHLIMDLPRGDRILINDRKPSSPRDTAYAINLTRNHGLESIRESWTCIGE